MATVKQLSGGTWVDYTSPLKTDVNEQVMEVVTVPQPITAGDVPFICAPTVAKAANTSALAATGLIIVVPYAGTYRFKWSAYSMYGGSCYSRLYQNGVAVGDQQTTAAGTTGEYSLDLACAAGDRVEVYLRGVRSDATYGAVGGLYACIDWDNGF